MSEQAGNGGPVFPLHGGCHEYQYCGLSLRDYFASKAITPVKGEQCPEYLMARAREAYAMADAMLAVRNEP